MKILHIIASIKKGESYSIKLGNAVVQKLQAANPGSTVAVHDLTQKPFPHLEELHLQAFYTHILVEVSPGR